MLGDFTYWNPTKLYFGENSLENLKKEIMGIFIDEMYQKFRG